MEANQQKPEDSLESATELESLDSQASSGDSSVIDTTTQSENPEQPTPEDDKKAKKKKRSNAPGLAGKLNIYLLIFIFIIVVAVVVTFIAYQQSKKADEKNQANISTTPLSEEDLEKLRQTDVKVGDPKQILSVESNAVFAGKVLVRDSLEVAGQLKIGGPLNLPGISVAGMSIFDQITANSLQIAGNTTIDGQLNVQNNVGISGNLTVGGTISSSRLNIETLVVNQDLQITRHIDAGGGTPGGSSGNALGGGGTASVSGTDTAGTISINTGGGTTPGCFININFTQRFNSPHIAIAPIGAAAGGINYYVNRSGTGFSLCTSNSAPAGQSFAFDYIVID